MATIKLIPGLIALLKMRNDRIARIKAAPAQGPEDPITAMAWAMHPEELHLTVTAVNEESDTVRTYRLIPADGTPGLPVFQAGQYLSLKLIIDKTFTSRAYTISSAPYEAEGKSGYYEITIRKKPNGLVSGHIFDQWKEGTAVTATGPHGDFFYSPLRDTREIVALAGGAGITPFRSMIKEYAERDPDMKLTILYGCRDERDELFAEELRDLCERHPGRFSRVNTYENANGNAALRKGYLDGQFILDNVEKPTEKTFFICGPTVMYDFIRREFPKVGALERKQMRFEACGAPDDVSRIPGFPKEAVGKTVSLDVRIGGFETIVPAASTESVLVALERAGIVTESRCRSGECGICRSKLVSGEVFILPDNDGRRAADRDLGYIHPCSTYPLTDMCVMIPPGKAARG